MPPLGPVTLPSGPPDAALWTADAEKQINALIYILCIIKFDLFFHNSAKQLKRESQSIIHQAKSAPQQTNEMIVGGLASA